MPVAGARVKPLSPFVISDGAALTTPPVAASALAERGVPKVFKFLWFTSGIFLVMLREGHRPCLRMHASLAKKNLGRIGCSFRRGS
jgi:hypothetical protein